VRRVRKRTAVLIGSVVVLVVGIAVVLGGGGYDGRVEDAGGGFAPVPAAPEVADGADAAESTDAPTAESRSSAGQALAVPAPGGSAGVPVGGVDRSLVRSATVTVEVGDPASAGRQVRTAVAAAGGFVAQEQSGTTGSWLVLRVPADGLDRLLADVGGLGVVLETSSQVLDATEEVVDLDARVASQQASVARIRALLAQAESIGDVVAIESELASREAELDSLVSRRAALADQVALATVTVDLRPAPGPGDEPDVAGFLGGLGAGWDGLRALGAVLAAAVGFLVPFLPVLAVVLGVGWAVRRVVRRRTATPAPADGGS
jgi:Domain of unknown function (DUF4349)